MDWDRLPASRWGLRRLGIVLLLGAYATGRHLVAIAPAHSGNQLPIFYLLALVAFLCFSIGGALAVHGHHLFEKVEIAERWRRLQPAELRPDAAVQISQTREVDAVPAPISPERSLPLSDLVSHRTRTRSLSVNDYQMRC